MRVYVCVYVRAGVCVYVCVYVRVHACACVHLFARCVAHHPRSHTHHVPQVGVWILSYCEYIQTHLQKMGQYCKLGEIRRALMVLANHPKQDLKTSAQLLRILATNLSTGTLALLSTGYPRASQTEVNDFEEFARGLLRDHVQDPNGTLSTISGGSVLRSEHDDADMRHLIWRTESVSPNAQCYKPGPLQPLHQPSPNPDTNPSALILGGTSLANPPNNSVSE